MSSTIYVCDVKCTTDVKRGTAPDECADPDQFAIVIQPGEQGRISRPDASLVSMGEYCEESFGGVWRYSNRAPGERYVGKILLYYSLAEDAGSNAKARMIAGDLVAIVQPG